MASVPLSNGNGDCGDYRAALKADFADPARIRFAGTYPASCAAVHDSVLLLVRMRDFHELLGRHPDLTRAVIASLAHRLRRMVMLVQELSLRDVRQRLLDLFHEMAKGGGSFELDLSHQELAARIGTVREIVSRTLSKLGQEGVIRVDGKTVTLLDRPSRPNPSS